MAASWIPLTSSRALPVARNLSWIAPDRAALTTPARRTPNEALTLALTHRWRVAAEGLQEKSRAAV